jgi:phosphoglycerate dehydrogenase-like enzyme
LVLIPIMTNSAAHRIALLDDYQRVALSMADWSRLRNCEVVAFDRNLDSEDERVAALGDFDVVMALRERMALPRTVLERLPRLKLIVTAGMRNASIDIAAAQARGIVVCGTGGLPYPTAELTIGLLLALARDIPGQQQALREGRWQTAAGRGLNGKTLGVLGLGTLGSRVARIALALEMNVVAWSRNLTDAKAAEVGARRVEFDELLRTSDFITIHLVLGDRTRGLIGARELALMKPTAYLVNTSRSPIIDEPALIQALEQGRIAGAGLDVYTKEPLPRDAPILRAPRTLLTPHLGYSTEETYRVFYGQALEDIEAWLAGAPVRVLSA